MAEVQQTSDATFRLFDWNRQDAQGRARPLHIEESLACIDWKRGPVNPVRAVGFPEQCGGAPAAGEVTQRLASCKYFTLDYLRRETPFEIGEGCLQVVVAVHGKGSLRGPDGSWELKAGDSLLLPAAMEPGKVYPQGPLGLLLAGLP